MFMKLNFWINQDKDLKNNPMRNKNTVHTGE